MITSFEKNEDGMRLMATFVAQLVKECVVFKIVDDMVTYKVELTGGF